jgi:hypothetical protein
MQHNELAAMFRNELTNRNIDITIEEWDRVIYNFAEKTFSNRTATIKAIHATIDSTICGKLQAIMCAERLDLL